MKEDGREILFVIYASPIAYSHGVSVLSAVLKKNGFSTRVFVANGNIEEFGKIVSKKWLAICFSHCIKKDFDLSIPYMELAIASNNEVLIGGTYHRRNNNNQFDGKVKICRGEGETLADYFNYRNDQLFTEKLRCNDLDSLPMADYEIFKNIPYDGHIKHFPNYYKLPYTASRGCIGKCSFCEVRHQEKGVRIRYRTIEDINYLNSIYDPELWFFTDELFPYHNVQFMNIFCSNMKKPYFAFIRADIDSNVLQDMINCGLKGVAFGVESGDEKYRNEVLNKNLTDDQIYRTCNILKKNNIYFAHFYMTHTDKETFSSKLKTDKMAMSLGGVPMIFDFTKVLYNQRSC
jgi:radical SAM superfamily enzyme YgiQ (UPF0313 family)